jgi:hypothetical protein
MIFGNWLWSSRRRQLFSAASASLKIMASAVLFDRHPLERTVRWRTVANELSMGLVVRRCFQCSDLPPILWTPDQVAWCSSRTKPLAIVISFDVSEQIVPGSVLIVPKQHRGIVPTISRPAHGFGYPSCIEDLAVIGSGVLAAAIGMMDQAWRRLLALDGHGQCRDRQVRPHVVTHRPANDLSGEKLEHDSQIVPSFLGWDIGSVGT